MIITFNKKIYIYIISRGKLLELDFDEKDERT